jgi:phage antirepressor YoqD-like protein
LERERKRDFVKFLKEHLILILMIETNTYMMEGRLETGSLKIETSPNQENGLVIGWRNLSRVS